MGKNITIVNAERKNIDESSNGMNGKVKLLALGIITMIAISGLAAYTVIANNTGSDPIRVACVGDSITEGSGYPDKLQTLLGSNYNVRNFGVSGSTVSQHSTLPYIDQIEFRKAEDFNPEIVVIMLGTNDANPEIAYSEDNFEADYIRLVNSFEELEGDQYIWVVKSPPIFDDNSAYNNTYLATTVLPRIDNVASQLDLPTVDMYNVFGNRSDYFMDGVHPNADGASLIAHNVYVAITMPDGSPDNTAFGP